MLHGLHLILNRVLVVVWKPLVRQKLIYFMRQLWIPTKHQFSTWKLFPDIKMKTIAFAEHTVLVPIASLFFFFFCSFPHSIFLSLHPSLEHIFILLYFEFGIFDLIAFIYMYNARKIVLFFGWKVQPNEKIFSQQIWWKLKWKIYLCWYVWIGRQRNIEIATT